jgi:hypothetical protein
MLAGQQQAVDVALAEPDRFGISAALAEPVRAGISAALTEPVRAGISAALAEPVRAGISAARRPGRGAGVVCLCCHDVPRFYRSNTSLVCLMCLEEHEM